MIEKKYVYIIIEIKIIVNKIVVLGVFSNKLVVFLFFCVWLNVSRYLTINQIFRPVT